MSVRGGVAGEATARRRVLHVGCGAKSRDHLPAPLRAADCDEVRLDIDPDCAPDIQADITDLSRLESGSFDALYSSHNLEHLHAHQVPVALAEFVRVLRPDTGLAVITCPDLQAIGRHLAEGKAETVLYDAPIGPVTPLDVLFGHRGAVARGQTHMAHRTGFTAETLVRAMDAAGFAAVTAMRQERSFALWAIGFRWAVPPEQRGAFRKAFLPSARSGPSSA